MVEDDITDNEDPGSRETIDVCRQALAVFFRNHSLSATKSLGVLAG
jgi:hypothetical protein